MSICDHRVLFQMDFLQADGTLIEGGSGHLQVISGTAGTWVIRLRVCSEEIPPGSVLEWRRYNIHMAGAFQDADPARRDYVSVECLGEADISLEIQADKIIRMEVGGAPLRPGDEVIVRLGDRSWGSAGSEVFWTTTEGRFTLDLIQDGERMSAADDVTVEVVCHWIADAMRLLGPTVVLPGEPFDLHLVVFDRNRNVVEPFAGGVSFENPDGLEGLPAGYFMTPDDSGITVLSKITAPGPGVYRVRATLEETGVEAWSNPIVCQDAPRARVYWGDLHAHGWGDCTMHLMADRIRKIEPLERHRQGHLVGRFDYGAPGAMSMPPDDAQRKEIWHAYEQAFQEADEPGQYVPFMSMEMHPGPAGDRQLIFRDRAPVPIDMREPVEHVYGLYAHRDDALLEVHIGGAPPYYSRFRPAEEKLVEVTSAFGNAEWLMQKCLRQGYRFAITGASDLHLGLMGAPRAVETFRGRFVRRLNVRDSGFGSGPVGAILAGRLNRSELWDGLQRRRGYATTGDRMYLHVDAGGFGMGDVAELSEPFDLTLTACGQDIVEQIDLIVGEHLADSIRPGKYDVEWSMSFDRDAMPPGRWLYFRVRQRNHEFGWTAPIWFADGEARGDRGRNWPAWNSESKPVTALGDSARGYLGDLEEYLTTEGDREKFGEILPVDVQSESMGRCARFISVFAGSAYPVTLRWFFEFEIPKFRVDWGYVGFGPVDCWEGPEAED